MKFDPCNDLESSLCSAKNNEISVAEFLLHLVHSDLTLPSASEVEDDGAGFRPIIYDKNGTKMLASFTDKARMGGLLHIATYCLTMNGLQVLRRIPRGVGLVINPGLEIGLDLSPDGIVQIIRDMS